MTYLTILCSTSRHILLAEIGQGHIVWACNTPYLIEGASLMLSPYTYLIKWVIAL